MLDHAVIDRLEQSPDPLAREALEYITELSDMLLDTQAQCIERGDRILASYDRAREQARGS